MSYSHRFWLYAPIALFLAIVGGYCAYWFVAVNRVETVLDHANGHDIMPGLQFAFAEKDVSGFPFRIDVVLGGVTLSYRGKDGETAWRSEKAAVHAQPYDLSQFIFEAAGLQSLTWPKPGAQPNVLYVTPGTARASAIIRDGKLYRFDADLAMLSGKDARAEDSAMRDFSAARAQFHALRSDANTISVMASLDKARIGAGYESVLGHAIEALTLSGSISQAPSLDAMLAGREDVSTALEKWRMAMGAFTAENFSITSDAQSLAVRGGTLTLDESHEFRGAIGALNF